MFTTTSYALSFFAMIIPCSAASMDLSEPSIATNIFENLPSRTNETIALASVKSIISNFKLDNKGLCSRKVPSLNYQFTRREIRFNTIRVFLNIILGNLLPPLNAFYVANRHD